MNIKEDPPLSRIKVASIIMKKTTEENIMIIQGMNLEGLHNKKDHSIPGMEFYFMIIVLFVLTLDIKLHIVEIMEEMVQE
jgi:hypothetical protein